MRLKIYLYKWNSSYTRREDKVVELPAEQGTAWKRESDWLVDKIEITE